MTAPLYTTYSMYHIEGNFGMCKIWWINYKNTFGDINWIWKFIMLFNIEQGILAEETLANLW